MNRLTLGLAYLLAIGCAQRDVSRGMEKEAIRAALEARLAAAEDKAQGNDFWGEMAPLDNVVFVGDAPKKVVEEPSFEPEAAPMQAVVPEPVEGLKLEDPANAVEVPKPAPVPAAPTPAVAEATPTLPPPSDPLQALLQSRGAGSSAGAGEIVRAIDDLRWTMTLESRLEDKQRLIDELRKDVDYPLGRTGPGDATRSGSVNTDPAIKAMALQLESLTAAAAEAEKARAEAATAAEAKAEQERVAAEAQQAAAEAEKKALQERISTLEAQTAKAVDSEPDAKERRQIERDKQKADDEKVAMAAEMARLKAQVQAIEAAQRKSDARRERQLFKLFKKKAKQPEASPAPVQPVIVQSSNAETDRLQAELARSEAARKDAEDETEENLATLEARLEAFEADRARLDEMKAELEAGEGDAERLKELEAATQALEADREKLGSLQTKVADLAAERARLEADLANADAARRAELEAERAAFEARNNALNEELSALRTKQAEMEQRFTDRQQAVMARLQPLIDSGLKVRQFEGNIVVDLPSDVLFASGSATLSKGGADEVTAVANALEPFPTLKIQVQGHTDNVPVNSSRFKTNWDLAFARSSAVLQVLLDGGLPAQRVSAASFGETRPVSNNDSKDGRAKNRRIELALELPPLEETP